MSRPTARRAPTADRPIMAVFLPGLTRRIAGFVLLLYLLAPASASAQPSDDTLVIPAGQRYAGNLATLTRDIRIDGTVEGDVTSWSGDIEVQGHVGGDVVSYSGRVTLLAGAQVDGHVLASGGTLRKDVGASVAGQTIRGESGGALASLVDLFSPTATSSGAAVGRVLFGAVLGVFMLAFTLLCAAFWPQRTAAAGLTLLRTPRRALALGLLSTLLLLLALPALAALLAATVIGMPLIVLLLALAQAPYVYGLATLARAAGSLRRAPTESDANMWSAAGLNTTTLGVAAALALLAAVIAALAPLWGLALLYLLASPGLGAVLLSRGGLLVPLTGRR